MIELESQREQSQREIIAVSTRLGILADEVVFQKRMSIIQSILLLLCIGLVIFSRSDASSYLELPVVQNMIARSQSTLRMPFESPSRSPSSTRPQSSWDHEGTPERHNGHLPLASQESTDAPHSPTLEFSPPTPTSLNPRSDSDDECEDPASPSTHEDPETPLTAIRRPLPCQTHSSPATLRSEGVMIDGFSCSCGEGTDESALLSPSSPTQWSTSTAKGSLSWTSEGLAGTPKKEDGAVLPALDILDGDHVK